MLHIKVKKHKNNFIPKLAELFQNISQTINQTPITNRTQAEILLNELENTYHWLFEFILDLSV